MTKTQKNDEKNDENPPKELKNPHDIEGSHRLLCKYTNLKDTAGQSASNNHSSEKEIFSNGRKAAGAKPSTAP